MVKERKRYGYGGTKENPLDNRITRELIIRGGLFDNKKPCYASVPNRSTKIDRLYNKLRNDNYGFGRSTWRNTAYSIAMWQIAMDNHIPVWFLKRYIKFITSKCIWSKQGDLSTTYIKIDERYDNPTDGLTPRTLNVSGAIENIELPEVYIEHKDVPVMIEGEEYYKKVPHTTHRSHISGLFTFRFYEADIIILWETMRDRFIAIHGVDCKMCNKHKKNKKPICSDLARYSIHICGDCLKTFCKLTDLAKAQQFSEMNNKVA